jgi:DNA-binding transcriptional MerR regulator
VSLHRPLPDKLYFKIGEVADLVGVKPHVLRYWETEFVALRPKKTRGAHRHYSRRDVELAMLLRRLLHDEGYTVPGAKKKLREIGHHRRSSPPEPNAAREVALRAELLAVKDQLLGLLALLDEDHQEVTAPDDAVQVTVHQVVQHRAPRRGL